jgi:hypothetical protein
LSTAQKPKAAIVTKEEAVIKHKANKEFLQVPLGKPPFTGAYWEAICTA